MVDVLVGIKFDHSANCGERTSCLKSALTGGEGNNIRSKKKEKRKRKRCDRA